MSDPLDLGRFVQRRQLRGYEQDLARAGYAYGVDLRRFQWLSHSLAAQTALRALELRWSEHAASLMTAGDLQYPEGADSLPILQELIRIAELLHATLPGIRFVTAKGRASRTWPLVTPLANSRGGDAWLVLDPQGLASLPAAERAFLLGQGLAHLQCGHGGLFMAHLMSAHHLGHGLTRALLRSWSQLAAFSADRAGLLAAGELESALHALDPRNLPVPEPAWFPTFAPLAERERALREFERSRVVARIRSQQRHRREQAPADEILAMLDQAPEKTPPDDTAPGEARSDPDRLHGAPTFEVPADAWPLARCDQRLTARLRLF